MEKYIFNFLDFILIDNFLIFCILIPFCIVIMELCKKEKTVSIINSILYFAIGTFTLLNLLAIQPSRIVQVLGTFTIITCFTKVLQEIAKIIDLENKLDIQKIIADYLMKLKKYLKHKN